MNSKRVLALILTVALCITMFAGCTNGTPTGEPTSEPTATPTAEPTATPTVEPTATPTAEPTATPTAEPTATPTAKPTATPTAEPTATPTATPTAEPTATPTAKPTATPTATPGAEPTATPTGSPEARIVTMNLVDNSNSEKVIVAKKFNTPSSFKSGNKFTLSVIYDNNMVLQANMNVRIFGKYSGSQSYVAAQVEKDSDKSKRTFYGEVKDGEFEIWLGVTDYGGPYTITLFDSEGYSKKLTNILFGEVWVLGGQSNMGWGLGQCYDGTTSKNLYADIIKTANNNNVRYMLVWPVSSDTPVEYLTSCSSWRAAQSNDVTNWSATGFFFAMEFNKMTGVPVGVISACMGGTSIDKWYVDTGIWYKGMVNPLNKMTVRGVCWYQGEGDYDKYGERLASLIASWRTEFENENLYWAAVQLPRYTNFEAYFKCRNEVRSLYGVVDKYTYCVTLDTGLFPEWKATGDTLNDDGIHPYDKQKVGERLADAVIGDFYGATGTWTSPRAVKFEKTANGDVLITYENVGDGLTLSGDLLNGFEMCKSNRKYYAATPTIVGKNQVLLHCDNVPEPFGVRYGYKNYRGKGITSAKDSVCLYSMVDGEEGYPAEQFWVLKNTDTDVVFFD